jgi:hypothetical protein
MSAAVGSAVSDSATSATVASHPHQGDLKEAQSVVPWKGLMVKIGRRLTSDDAGKLMVRVHPCKLLKDQSLDLIPNIFRENGTIKSKEQILQAVKEKAVKVVNVFHDRVKIERQVQVKSADDTMEINRKWMDDGWVEADQFFNKLSNIVKTFFAAPEKQKNEESHRLYDIRHSVSIGQLVAPPHQVIKPDEQEIEVAKDFAHTLNLGMNPATPQNYMDPLESIKGLSGTLQRDDESINFRFWSY